MLNAHAIEQIQIAVGNDLSGSSSAKVNGGGVLNRGHIDIPSGPDGPDGPFRYGDIRAEKLEVPARVNRGIFPVAEAFDVEEQPLDISGLGNK